jgi:hypothetical protein
MDTTTNKGFDPEEINMLREELREEGRSFAYVEDDELDADVLESGECVRVEFLGQYNGQDVIYDAIVYTLRLHHSSMVYETAVTQIQQTYPDYIAPEERPADYKIAPDREEEIETLLTELIEELEETEAVKVQEHVEMDTDADYGIALDVCLNEEEITDEVLERFISAFNSNTISLDKTLYSFSSEEDEE